VTAEQVRKEIAASAKTKLGSRRGSQEAETRGTASSERGGEKNQIPKFTGEVRELIIKINQFPVTIFGRWKVDPADAEYQEIGGKENPATEY